MEKYRVQIMRFLSALNEYFAICASKNLQKSSAIQKKINNFVFGNHSDYCFVFLCN